MRNDEIIGRPRAERRFEIFKPLFAYPSVRRVQDRHLFIEDDVGIVRHAVHKRILPLEEVQGGIVATDVTNVFCNVFIYSVCISVAAEFVGAEQDGDVSDVLLCDEAFDIGGF